MTPEQINEAWSKVIEGLQGEAGVRIMHSLGNDANAQIANRIIETGADAEGGNYQAKRPYNPGYLEFKKSEGRYRGFVDFSLTGLTWKQTQVLQGDTTSNTVTIGGLSAQAQENLRKNAAKWGDILKMNKVEKENATGYYIEEMMKLFKEQGL